jgi:hypothetical protein
MILTNGDIYIGINGKIFFQRILRLSNAMRKAKWELGTGRV